MAERCGQCGRTIDSFDNDQGADSCDACGHNCHAECMVSCEKGELLLCTTCWEASGKPEPTVHEDFEKNATT